MIARLGDDADLSLRGAAKASVIEAKLPSLASRRSLGDALPRIGQVVAEHREERIDEALASRLLVAADVLGQLLHALRVRLDRLTQV